MNSPVHCPELLAPAGDAEALRAAVANGADAVYFGLDDFNARYRATNFTLAELPATMQFLREHGVRGYVTFNTLVFSDELERAAEYLQAVVRAGADAVIVQDLGIVRLLRRMAPDFPVHGSTQMTLTEPRGIEFVRGLGVERVILARELSLKEIGRIAGATRVPLEVFVHGALCVAYSGQCLTSESLGGRSANRGQCAQACRQPYELIVDGTQRDLGDKAYLLSPQDLAAFDLVGDLAALGVHSLKIEGRLKSAQYVAMTSQTYRAAIDAAVSQQLFTLSPQQHLDLAQSFSRGFTHGFLSGVNHQELVHGRFPKHRGNCIGTVADVLPDGVLVEVSSSVGTPSNGPGSVKTAAAKGGDHVVLVKPGDGVVFDEGHPEQDEQGGRVFSADPSPAPYQAAGSRRAASRQPAYTGGGGSPGRFVKLKFGEGSVNLAAVSVGAKVWKTDDPALRRRLERTYQGADAPRQSPVRVQVSAAEGTPLEVVWRDDAGHSVRVTTSQPLARAEKHPITQELVREQLGRLGGTPFFLHDVELLWEGVRCAPEGNLPVMAPKSVLNDLRRQGIAALLKLRRMPRDQTLNVEALPELRAEVQRANAVPDVAAASVAQPAGAFAGSRETAAPCLSVLVRSLEQLRAVLNGGPGHDPQHLELVYCDFEDVRLFRDAVKLGRAAGIPIGLATPRIVKPGEEGLLQQVARCEPTAVLIRNLAGLTWFQEHAPALRLVGDYALNVANELTAAMFVERGLARLVPSYDLNLEQLRALLKQFDPRWFEVVLHQHMPMFHMEHCIFSHVLSNGKDFHDCGRPCDRHRVELRDHVGEAHPLAADVGCRNTVFNAQPQSAAAYVPQLREWGVSRFRVEMLRESAEEARVLVETYARVLDGNQPNLSLSRPLRVLNQLGVTRGTLEFE